MAKVLLPQGVDNGKGKLQTIQSSQETVILDKHGSGKLHAGPIPLSL